MTEPRYGPAVLRALAAYAEKLRAYYNAPWPREGYLYDERVDALNVLDIALCDAAARAAVPALPDEGERDASPHRFAHPHGGPL